MRTRRLALALAAAAVLASTPASGAAPAGPSIRIVSVEAMHAPGVLRDMFDRVYEVRVAITGWKLYRTNLNHQAPPPGNRPGGGHWHLYVDGEYASSSNDALAHTWYLTPGRHTIYAELAAVDHAPLSGMHAWSKDAVVQVP
jgi:hypothetical protein